MPEPDTPSDTDIEVAFLFLTHDREALLRDLAEALPEADLEPIDHFIGGPEIAAFLKLSVDTLRTVLAFISRNRARISGATLKIGPQGIEVINCAPDQAADLLDSPGVRNAIERYTRETPP